MKRSDRDAIDMRAGEQPGVSGGLHGGGRAQHERAGVHGAHPLVPRRAAALRALCRHHSRREHHQRERRALTGRSLGPRPRARRLSALLFLPLSCPLQTEPRVSSFKHRASETHARTQDTTSAQHRNTHTHTHTMPHVRIL